MGRPPVALDRLTARRAVMSDPTRSTTTEGPLADLDDWMETHRVETNGLGQEGFRDYRKNVRPGVREFYHQNHAHQTLDFVLGKKAEYTPRTRRTMGIWEAMEYL